MTYFIRSRRHDWLEVDREKAIDYAKTHLRLLGYCYKNRELKESYLKRFVKGITLDDIEQGR